MECDCGERMERIIKPNGNVAWVCICGNYKETKELAPSVYNGDWNNEG